jgi:hypothetical protein
VHSHILIGAAPHGIQTVAALRLPDLLILLVPVGMVMREAQRRMIAVLTPAERDAVRMMYGHPPVGMQPSADWSNLDAPWCPGSVPEGHRIDVPDCCVVELGPARVAS